jgi:DNA uptake protein ComE-like DNA-binding protein
MTQRLETVEPPLDSTRVQLLVATFVTIALVVASGGVSESRVAEPQMSMASQSQWGIAIDLNRATPRELALLPGVGPVLAKRIAENRDRLGRFPSVQDVGRVYGVGSKTIDLFAEYVTVNAGTVDSGEVDSGEVDSGTAPSSRLASAATESDRSDH